MAKLNEQIYINLAYRINLNMLMNVNQKQRHEDTKISTQNSMKIIYTKYKLGNVHKDM